MGILKSLTLILVQRLRLWAHQVPIDCFQSIGFVIFHGYYFASVVQSHSNSNSLGNHADPVPASLTIVVLNHISLVRTESHSNEWISWCEVFASRCSASMGVPFRAGRSVDEILRGAAWKDGAVGNTITLSCTK
ncbi:hypothetical protein H4582DRAFT_1961788 [Lactarius indigo]|nr:hypothetical protein H4582DRAFT_1961788 [Lactarius indigo]